MRVLVTGCGGFLGSHIVQQLLDRGDKVVGISRQRYPALTKLGMIHRQGDLTDPDWTLANVRDVDIVVHTAALAGVWGKWQTFFDVNVKATDHVIEACQINGISALVYTSSPSVSFGGSDQSGVDESVPYPTRWLCHYPHTKAIAEQAVLRAHQLDRLVTCSLRPHLIWGKGDPHLLPRLVQRARQGRLRIVGNGHNRMDAVHVVNAAASHLSAIDALQCYPHDVGGRSYFIAQDEPINCWDWISEICQSAGVDPPSKRISFAAAYGLGATLELAYHATWRSSEPPMTRFVAAQLARDHYFDISAAKERLGYQPSVTMDQGLADASEYLKSL